MHSSAVLLHTLQSPFAAFLASPGSDSLRAAVNQRAFLQAKYGIVSDPVLSPFLDEIADRLRNPPRIPAGLETFYEKIRETPFEIGILNSKEPIACVLPDGACYVSYGYLAMCGTVDEAAGGIAHEIVHCTESGPMSPRFSEKRADVVSAMAVADAAGYNPTHFIKLFRKFLANAKENGQRDYSSDHGSLSDRIADLLTLFFVHDVENSFIPGTPISSEYQEAIEQGISNVPAERIFTMADLSRALESLSDDAVSWAILSLVARGVRNQSVEEIAERVKREDPDPENFGFVLAIENREWDRSRQELITQGLADFFREQGVRKPTADLLTELFMIDCNCRAWNPLTLSHEMPAYISSELCAGLDCRTYTSVVREAAEAAERLGLSLFNKEHGFWAYDDESLIHDIAAHFVRQEVFQGDEAATEPLSGRFKRSIVLCNELGALFESCGKKTDTKRLFSDSISREIHQRAMRLDSGGEEVFKELDRSIETLRGFVDEMESSDDAVTCAICSLLIVDRFAASIPDSSEIPGYVLSRIKDEKEVSRVRKGYDECAKEVDIEVARAARYMDGILEREGFNRDERLMIAEILSDPPEHRTGRRGPGSSVFAELRGGEADISNVRTAEVVSFFSRISEKMPVPMRPWFQEEYGCSLARAGRFEELRNFAGFITQLGDADSLADYRLRTIMRKVLPEGLPLERKLLFIETLSEIAGQPVSLDEDSLPFVVEDVCALEDEEARMAAFTRIVKASSVKSVSCEGRYSPHAAKTLRELIEHTRDRKDLFVLSHFLPRTGWSSVFQREAFKGLLSGCTFEEAHAIGTVEFPAISTSRTGEWIAFMDQHCARSNSDFARLQDLVAAEVGKREEDISLALYLEDVGTLFKGESVEEVLTASLLSSRDEGPLIECMAHYWIGSARAYFGIEPLREKVARLYQLSNDQKLALLRMALLNPQSGIFHDKNTARRVLGKFIDTFIEDGVLVKKTAASVIGAFVEHLDPEQLFVYFAPALLDVLLRPPEKQADHSGIVEEVAEKHLKSALRKHRKDELGDDLERLVETFAPGEPEVTTGHIVAASGYTGPVTEKELTAELNVTAGFEVRDAPSVKPIKAIDALKRAADWAGVAAKRLLQFTAMSSRLSPDTRTFLLHEGLYHDMSEARFRTEAWSMIKREMPSFFEEYQLGDQIGSGSTYTAYDVLDLNGSQTGLVVRVLSPNALYKSFTFLEDMKRVIPSLKRKMNPAIRAVSRICEGLLPMLEQSIVEDVMWYRARSSEERFRAHDGFTHAGGRIRIPRIISMSADDRPRFVIIEEKAEGRVFSEILGEGEASVEGVSLKDIVSLLAHSLKEQTRLGLVHGDFHPGNEIFLPEQMLCWLIDRNRPAEVPDTLRDIFSDTKSLRSRKQRQERLERLARELVGSAEVPEKISARIHADAKGCVAGSRKPFDTDALFELTAMMAERGVYPSLDMFLLLRSMHYTGSVAEVAGFTDLAAALSWKG